MVAAIAGTLTPEVAAKIAVTPAERAAREAKQILLTRQLQETTGLLEKYTRLLDQHNTSSAYLPKDLNVLQNWKAMIEQHLSTAAVYEKGLGLNAILNLPRLHMDAVWHRISRFPGADPRDLLTPAQIPTRFNPGPALGDEFMSMALAEDLSTATFELSAHIDLADTIEFLKRMTLTQFQVMLRDVADLSDPDAVKRALGIDFAALLGTGFHDRLSVTQQICVTLVQAGFEGAIFPSRTTLGKKNLVMFPSNVHSRNAFTVLFSGSLAV